MLNILIAQYESLSSAGKAVGADKRKISHACTFGKFYKGSYWSYDPKPCFKNKGDLRKKSVLQYDLEDNLLDVYISASEASRQTGISKTCITRCCRGEREQSRGFKWKYNNSFRS